MDTPEAAIARLEERVQAHDVLLEQHFKRIESIQANMKNFFIAALVVASAAAMFGEDVITKIFKKPTISWTEPGPGHPRYRVHYKDESFAKRFGKDD